MDETGKPPMNVKQLESATGAAESESATIERYAEEFNRLTHQFDETIALIDGAIAKGDHPRGHLQQLKSLDERLSSIEEAMKYALQRALKLDE